MRAAAPAPASSARGRKPHRAPTANMPAATAVCNKVKTESDIKEALRFAKSIEGVFGAVVIYGDKMGSIGDIELEV